MKTRGIISIAALISALSAPAFAGSIDTGSDQLYKNSRRNLNLDSSEYDFSGQHSRYRSKFRDSWKFTVATDTTVSISVYDLEKPLDDQKASRGLSARQRQSLNQFNTAKVFDTKNLTLSVFDSKHRLIGQTGENGTLTNLSLLAGGWYTIQITGRVNSFAGSAYRGVLDMTPAPVPLGDTAPLFGSALALLALRYRKRFANLI